MSEKIILDTSLNTLYHKLGEINDIKSFLNYYNEIVDKKVVGWFYPIDIIIFFDIIKNIQTNINGDICELGVAFGKSSIGLSLLKRNDENLYLYDFFVNPEISLESASSTIEKYGNKNNVEWRVQDLFKLNSDDIKFSQKLRFIHIDSCHQHAAVLKDLNNFSLHLKDDGVICLDDINDPNYPGVNTAVSEFILSEQGKDWRIFAIGANKAYLCKKQFFDFYRNTLVQNMMNTINQIGINFAEVFDEECVLLLGQQGLSETEIKEYIDRKKVRFYG